MTWWLVAGLCLLSVGDAGAQTGNSASTNVSPTAATPATTPDPMDDVAKQAQAAYRAWAAERNPAKRSGLADQLVQIVGPAITQTPDPDLTDLTDKVAREGAPMREITPPANVQAVVLSPLTTLTGFHISRTDPYTPVFRRISRQDIEAWTPNEGWLFDAQGKVLADVHVPRRGGSGREWFGAFLPDGTWITTDIWENDQQLNCFTPSGKWKWEVTGKKIAGPVPKEDLEGPGWYVPLIGWARADKTGRRWLVSVGAYDMCSFALIDESGRAHSPAGNGTLWQLVYSRAMGVRGGNERSINSDDAKLSLDYQCASHGIFCDWPTYSLSGKWRKTICGGLPQFGFWPKSHHSYVENSEETWFFNEDGKYEGQIAGTVLADAANGQDLLLANGGNRVSEAICGKDGVAIANVRTFSWPDGSQAAPAAIYDDLKLGFFFTGEKPTNPLTDDTPEERGAGIIMAKW